MAGDYLVNLQLCFELFNMVFPCLAYGFTNGTKAWSGISFHRFPLDNPELLQKWIQAVGWKNWTPNKYSYCVGFTSKYLAFLRNLGKQVITYMLT